MLENHSKKHSEIIVQKKQRKIQRKKKKPAVSDKSGNEDQLNEQWDAVTSELSAAIQGRRPIPDVTAFDGASAMSFEEQKVEAIYKIREALISNEPFKALGLLRASRELWPEGDSFGSAEIEPEPEFLILREIHFSNLQKQSAENNNKGIEDSEDENEELEALPPVVEKKLDMNEIYKRYASHKVVQPCSLLLANYRKNKPQTNICLIKFLHRIAWHCKMHALFFQSSIFLTFQKVFHDPDINNDPIMKEFYRFARFIIEKFFIAAEKNDKIFVELLFWKGPREAYELEEGYGTSESKVKGWTEDEEEELKYLFEENKDIYIEGQDVADIILANFNSRNRTKPQIISALKRLSLIKCAKDLKPEKRKEWLETEIIELQNLFEDYKNSEDVMTVILDKLSIKRQKKAVIEKLLELNLIKDRKEIRKRSSKNSKKSKFNDSDGNSDESEHDLFDGENYNPHLSAESSGDEDEINFFKNLEAERIAEGEIDMSYSENKLSNGNAENKRLLEIWEEQEILKLKTLFKENHESDNVMDILLNELPKNRSKKSIVAKLLELGLIKDKKEINTQRTTTKMRKEKLFRSGSRGNHIDLDNDSNSESDDNISKNLKKKRKLKQHLLDSSDEDISPKNILNLKDSKSNKNIKEGKHKKKKCKAWEEKEIIELNQLYLEHKDSNDVISSIMSHLTFKQTKKNITEKLLEIGLIKDKTEVKKKNSSVKKGSVIKSPDDVSEKEKRKKLSNIWEEKEIVELNQLFLEHKDSDDVISNIIKDLTFKQTKKNIVQKLLENGLIKDKTVLKKNSLHNRKLGNDAPKRVRKKKAEVWDEQEILELTQLYQKYKDRHDIMASILHDLTVKRQKRHVIEKMLEMGLIQDKEVNMKKGFKNLKEQNLKEVSVLKGNSMNHPKSSKKVLSDLSDDESLPLSHIVAASAEYNRTDNIFIANSSMNSEISLSDKSSVTHVDLTDELPRMSNNFYRITDSIEFSNNLSRKNIKRKRVFINSDDSGDDDDDNLIVEPIKYDVVGLKDINSFEHDFQDHNVPKFQKKRMRVLNDSDSD